MKEARSLTRKTSTLAISSGPAVRPRGWAWPSLALRFGHISARGFEGLLLQGGVHPAGTDGQHPDVVGGKIQRQVAGQGKDASLAGRVGRDILHGLQTLHAGHVDDHASAPKLHLRNGELGHQEEALEIDVNDAIPEFLRGVHRIQVGTGRLDPDVVDQDVDPPKGLIGLTNHPGRLRGVGHVRRHVLDRQPFIPGQVQQFPIGRSIDIGKNDRGSLSTQGQRAGAANALGPAGHDSHFAFQPFHGMPPLIVNSPPAESWSSPRLVPPPPCRADHYEEKRPIAE